MNLRTSKSSESSRYPLSLNVTAPVFGHKCTSGSLSRAMQVQALFSQQGLPYLLPNQVWSDRKILAKVEEFCKTLNRLEKIEQLNKILLQRVVDNLLPNHVKGKIIIKDRNDFVQDARAIDYSEPEIEEHLGRRALCLESEDNSTIYINFETVAKDARVQKFNAIMLKVCATHEFTHALFSRLQNTNTVTLLKNSNSVCANQQKAASDIFLEMEYISELLHFYWAPGVPSQKLMLKKLNLTSIDDLHKQFGAKLDELVEENVASGKLNIDNPEDKKFYYLTLKNRAKEEKYAYQTIRILREFFGDTNAPTTAELLPMFYVEMEKFFERKIQELKPN